ncbi:LOW QUALITY PROTEIN: protein GR6-like [Sapajus apella]|uniref:LOW QUALITY PROTEIN: protein GR6-like n=1 Tax=Sapajus apella TaxID=9515 RepID=A0A6J3H1K2_SAPAP|nr:LOW QUALITY PROTEIN: protein GR6-like [Sapajus apella]
MKEALHQIVGRCSELVSSTSLPRLSVFHLQGPPDSQPLSTLGQDGWRLLGSSGCLAPETLRGLETEESGPCTHPLPFDIVERERETDDDLRQGWLLQSPRCARTLLGHCGRFLTPPSQASSSGFQPYPLKSLSNFPFSYFP